MSKLDDLIQELCPNGVEYKTLGQIGKMADSCIVVLYNPNDNACIWQN